MKLRPFLALLLAAALLFTLTACGDDREGNSQSSDDTIPPASEDYPVELRGTVISTQPMRVVSLSPAITEMLFDMGLDSYLVGVSDYCDTPEGAVDDLPHCGTAQKPDLAAIKKADGRLVLSSASLQEADVTQLLQQEADVLVLPRAANMDELKTLYTDLLRALEGDTVGSGDAEIYWEGFQERMDDLAARGEAFAATNEGKPTAIFLRMLDFTMATGDTFESKLLEEMGMTNLAANYGDWTFPKDNAAQLTPDLIISNSDITISILEQNPTYKGTQAVIKDRVVTVDMTAFERQVPRMFDELEKVADFLFGTESDDGGDSGQE